MIRTEGIVVKVQPYRESSVIFRLYTAESGLLTVMARGARRPKSPYGECLRTFVKGDFVLYFSGRSEFHHLREALLISDPGELLANEDRYLIANAIIEFTTKSSPVGVVNPRIFCLLDHHLDKLKTVQAWKEMLGIFVNFMVQILKTIGYLPPLDHCLECGSKDIQSFSVVRGGCLCPRHSSEAIQLDRPVVDAIRRLSRGNPPSDIVALNRIFDLLFSFYRYHVGGFEFATGLAIDRKRRAGRI